MPLTTNPKPSTPALGVCYYPEQWDEGRWPADLQRMKSLGIRYVRVAEFAWSRFEPEPERFEFSWLQRFLDLAKKEGLAVVVGTPTATPPKWLVDSMPDMIALDQDGLPRAFGSRRHYCFSHQGYRDKCRQIVTQLAQAVGAHPAVYGWVLVQIVSSVYFYLARRFCNSKRTGQRPKCPERCLLFRLVV